MAESSSKGPVILIIRDGWGENPNPEHDPFNAVKQATTPCDDALRRDWPWTLIRTCGEDVGLPAGTMGNSEVGHQNIGAGRVVDQEIMRITNAIRTGEFFRKRGLVAAFEHAERTGGNVHFMGLLSDGKVHSDIEHLFALIDMAAGRGFPGERVFVHVFTDGRDVGPFTGRGFIEALESKLADLSGARIATVIGRYWAMDRDLRWHRTERAYQCLTGGRNPEARTGQAVCRGAACPVEAAQAYYDNPEDDSLKGDEFIPPTPVIDLDLDGSISDGDSVVFFNFRGDRPRQLVRAFMLSDEEWEAVEGHFDRGPRLEDFYFCGMTNYEQGLPMSAVAFDKPPKMPDILGQVVSEAGLRQFRSAETEKFPHVTFFFNDYREEPFVGESRGLVPSPREVGTYDQKPEMSAPGVCATVLERLAADDCEDLIIVNFANPDMVGHTGKHEAIVKAVEVVDACVGQIIDATLARGGSLIITADHGNAEQTWNPETNSPHTAHTTYDVPLYVVSPAHRGAALRDGGRLADIAPTVLQLAGISVPAAMTGASLLDA